MSETGETVPVPGEPVVVHAGLASAAGTATQPPAADDSAEDED